jgi:hypothetical protein
MKQPYTTSQVPVELTPTDWISIIAILQVQAKQEHRRGNFETADEIRVLVDRVAIQL